MDNLTCYANWLKVQLRLELGGELTFHYYYSNKCIHVWCICIHIKLAIVEIFSFPKHWPKQVLVTLITSQDLNLIYISAWKYQIRLSCPNQFFFSSKLVRIFLMIIHFSVSNQSLFCFLYVFTTKHALCEQWSMGMRFWVLTFLVFSADSRGRRHKQIYKGSKVQM